MKAKTLIQVIQGLIDIGEITEDYKVEYANRDFLGRSTVDYIRIEQEKKVILLCEEWF
jgi:hypothetical protein